MIRESNQKNIKITIYQTKHTPLTEIFSSTMCFKKRGRKFGAKEVEKKAKSWNIRISDLHHLVQQLRNSKYLLIDLYKSYSIASRKRPVKTNDSRLQYKRKNSILRQKR